MANFSFLEKLKQSKHKEVFVAIALAMVVLVVLVLGNVPKQEPSSEVDAYIASMETKLQKIVESIDGCGKATVAISYSSTESKEYAFENTTSTESGVVVQTSTIVLVNGQPLVLKNLTPNILGVVVVAEGANNAITKMKIVDAVVTLLDVETNKVQVFDHK